MCVCVLTVHTAHLMFAGKPLYHCELLRDRDGLYTSPVPYWLTEPASECLPSSNNGSRSAMTVCVCVCVCVCACAGFTAFETSEKINKNLRVKMYRKNSTHPASAASNQ